jgi:hypothetical protein
MAIKTHLGVIRYNNKMDRIMANARRIEKERLSKGEEPNPSLTSPEEAKKHGWEIKGREVKKIVAKKMKENTQEEKASIQKLNKVTL